MGRIALVWFAIILNGSLTAAQDVSEDAGSEAEARALFEAGRVAYSEGRFDNALESFRRAHELSGRPELLFNIGQSADRLRRDAEAIDAFEAFLEARPEHENAAAVRARLEVLHQEEATRRADAEERDRLRAEAATPSPAPWVLIAGGGAAVVVGGVLVGLAIRDRNEIENLEEPTPWPELRDQVDRVPTFSTTGIVLLGVGGAALLAGIIWKLALPGDTELALSPRHLMLSGRF